MPRIRTVKPEFFTSETIAKCSFRARVLFVGLWTQADDEGRLVDNARVIKGQLFALDDDVSSADVEADLEALEAHGLVVRYEANGRRYLAIRGFLEHQSINRPSASKLPAPPEDDGAVRDDSLRAHGGVSEDSLQERKGKEVERNTRDEPLAPVLPITSEPDGSAVLADFELFWDAYPRHVERKRAINAWKRLKVADRRLALEGAKAFAEHHKRLRTEVKFLVYPGKWLDGRRWEDEEIKPVSASGNRDEHGRVFDPDTGAWLAASAVGRM